MHYEESSEIFATEGSFEAFARDAGRRGVLAEEVECEMADDGEVFRRVAGPLSMAAFMKGYVQRPGEWVFNGPVVPNEPGVGCGIGGATAQE